MLNLRGRLGNQILQLNYYLSNKKDKRLINTALFELDEVFHDLNLPQIKSYTIQLIAKVLRNIVSKITGQFVDLVFLGIYEGYFQKEIELQENFKNYLKTKLIPTHKADLVIHCRGEDYLSKKNLKIYNTITPQHVINLLQSNRLKIPKTVFLVGNDDSTLNIFCKRLGNSFEDVRFEIYKGKSTWEDFSFISNSKTCIISNSTFSLCARLLDASSRTYCPKNWFKTNYYNQPFIKEFNYFDNA